jgi:hypothetical protein
MMAKKNSTYEVCGSARLADLLGEKSGVPWLLSPEVEITYHWDHGTETLEIKDEKGHLILHHWNIFHPNVVCETGSVETSGICLYCGNIVP